MLKAFGQEIWIADGANVAVAGFHYPTRMAVIRLSNDDLFVWSPIALGSDLCAAVDALGPVRYIVAPNSLHHLSLLDWQNAYPNAKLYAAPRLTNKRRDIRFAGILADAPNAEWSEDVDQVIVRGNIITTEVVFFHRASRTALFTDLIQQLPDGWHKGFRARIAKLDLMVEPVPTVPRKFRAAFVNRRAARRGIAMVRTWPVENVLMAHGEPVKGGGAAFIASAFSWLIK